MHYLYLSLAIIAEVFATTLLKASNGFSKPLANFGVALGYALAFYFLSLTLRTLPMGIAYAIWSGAGIVLIALAGWAIYGQSLDKPALLGMTLILAGVVVMNVFSKSAA